MRVLAVEANEAVLCSIETELGASKFNVYGTHEAEEAIELAYLYDYDVIVLPDVDTVRVIRTLRDKRVRTPVIVLGTDAAHATVALDAGADDYIVRPFSFDELIARIRAVVRRSAGHPENVLTCGELTLNLSTHSVTYAGTPVHVTGKEFALLQLLALRKNTVQTKEGLMNNLYDGFDDPDVKIVDVFVCKLRKKLAKAGAPPDLIETSWGRGYMLRDKPDDKPVMRAEVREIIEEPPLMVTHMTAAEREAVIAKKRFGKVA